MIWAGSSLCLEVSLVMNDNINQTSSATVPGVLHCRCCQAGTPIAKVVFVGSGGIDGVSILPAAGCRIPLQQNSDVPLAKIVRFGFRLSGLAIPNSLQRANL